MARPKKRIGEIETPERIANAALEEFAKHGYAQANLATIAKSCGISRPSLLYHFKSKDELFEHVLLRAFVEVGEVLRVAMRTEGEFQDGLHAVVLGFHEYMRQKPHVAGIIARELVHPDGLGRELLINQTMPLLTEVEQWVLDNEQGELRHGADVRNVLMHVVSNSILSASSGDLVHTIWGEPDPWGLVQMTLLKESL